MNNVVMFRDGSTAEDRRFGRLVQYDDRSLDYSVRPLLLESADEVRTDQIKLRSYRWAIDQWRDQLREGACVTFALGHKLIGRPQEHLDKFHYDELVNYYHQAQLIDPWPETHPDGEGGTSILAGVKVLQQAGYFDSYRWVLGGEEGLRDAVLTLGYVGGLVMGSWWWSMMYNTDADGFVVPEGRKVGGHAWYTYGIKVRDANDKFTDSFEEMDLDKTIVYCRNSWGPVWGKNGDFKLTLRNWNKLRLDYGEAVYPVEVGRWFHGEQID